MIQFAAGAYSRPTYGLPEAVAFNVITEATPNGPGRYAHLPRPALRYRQVIGDGPIRGISKEAGVFAGSTFAVSGQELYRLGNLIGVVDGSDMVRWASSATQLVVVGGGKAYCFDKPSATFAQITDPDLPEVGEVFFIGGRFFFCVLGSDRVYFSAIDDARVIDGLAFQTVESRPDPVVAAVVVSAQQVVFFGEKTLEFWGLSGSADDPLIPGMARKFDKGCVNPSCVVPIDNSFIFVGRDRMVYRFSDVPQRISNHGIEERLRKSSDIDAITAWSLEIDGHVLYGLNIPGQGAVVYDLTTQLWHEWGNLGYVGMRVSCGFSLEGEHWFGDAVTGRLWQFDPEEVEDSDGPIVKVVSCEAPSQQRVRNFNVVLQCVKGLTPALGDGNDGTVEMRYSDDGGRTWEGWRSETIGELGQTDIVAVWGPLGTIRSPGRGFQFRTALPMRFVPEFAALNLHRP